MQKIIACFVCILALLTVAMPVIIAEDNLNSTSNVTLNRTQNATKNVTLNLTRNASENITLNEIQNTAPGITREASQNTTQSTTQQGAQNAAQHTKVLRAGFEKTKPLNNLDVYGNKSTYNIPTRDVSGSAFNLSQRLGNTSKFIYNTNIYKPIYNVSQYSRTKPIYEVPSTLSVKPVYSISGYPVIKAPNSIP